jgi:hypothetical protein
MRFAISEAPDGFLTLVGSQRRRPAETHATCLCTGAAVTCAGEDKLPFEFGEAAQHRDHQPAARGARVGCGTCRTGVWKNPHKIESCDINKTAHLLSEMARALKILCRQVVRAPLVLRSEVNRLQPRGISARRSKSCSSAAQS